MQASQKTIREDLKNNTLKKIYLLYGEETYLVNLYKNKLKEAIIGDDTMNFNYAEGKKIDFNEINEAAFAMPFFADNRLVMLENTGLFKNASKDEWVGLVENLPETTYLIFIESEVDKKTKMYKRVANVGDCVEMTHPSEDELRTWVLKGFEAYGCKVSRGALDLFIQKCSDSMERMKGEISKLADYCMERGVITEEDVEAVTCAHIEDRVFVMIEDVTMGKKREAMELYYDLVALNVDSRKIISLIARQVNQLLMVKNLRKAGADRSTIAAKVKVPPFVAGKLLNLEKTFASEEVLRRYLELCVSSDEATKNGDMDPTIAVEMIILTIAGREYEK